MKTITGNKKRFIVSYNGDWSFEKAVATISTALVYFLIITVINLWHQKIAPVSGIVGVNVILAVIGLGVIAAYVMCRVRFLSNRKRVIKKRLRALIESFSMFTVKRERDISNLVVEQRYKKVRVKRSAQFRVEIRQFRVTVQAIKRGYKWESQYTKDDFIAALESAVDGTCIEKQVTQDFVMYTFRVGQIERIEYEAQGKFGQDKEIAITSERNWKYLKEPHGLIVGGTGSGKSYFAYYLLSEFVKRDAYLFVIDPKKMDFLMMKDTVYTVATETSEMFKTVKTVLAIMEERSEVLAQNKNMDYQPVVLYIDEYPALMASLNKQMKEDFQNIVQQIVFKGRAARVFVILAAQRPDANYLGGALRDNLSLRVALGMMSDDGNKMVFGIGGNFESCGSQSGYYIIGGSNMTVAEKFETAAMAQDFDFKEVLDDTADNFKAKFDGISEYDTVLQTHLESI